MAAEDWFNDRRSLERQGDEDFDVVLAKRRRKAGLPVGRRGKGEVTENSEGEWPSTQGMW